MKPPGCGPCTACCTIMKVEMEPVKPAYVRCQHVCAAGCGIYERRPDPCREWSCVWLHSQDKPDIAMPGHLRPDRSGVVLNLNHVGNILAHCATADSWKRDKIRQWLERQAQRAPVLLIAPESVNLLKPDGSTEALHFAGIDKATNERIYKRSHRPDFLKI